MTDIFRCVTLTTNVIFQCRICQKINSLSVYPVRFTVFGLDLGDLCLCIAYADMHTCINTFQYIVHICIDTYQICIIWRSRPSGPGESRVAENNGLQQRTASYSRMSLSTIPHQPANRCEFWVISRGFYHLPDFFKQASNHYDYEFAHGNQTTVTPPVTY